MTRDTSPMTIRIRGARQNNLKNLDLDITPGTFVVLTGVSGAGKSSLAFDTIFNEGQRRYIETFSPYARQFLARSQRPDVDLIDAIPPAIAIEQKNTIHTPRSSVGSLTEINDYLRLLMSHLGQLYCSHCGHPVNQTSLKEMVTRMQQWASTIDLPRVGIYFEVCAPKTLEESIVQDGLTANGFTQLLEHYDKGQDRIYRVSADRMRRDKLDSDRLLQSFELAQKFSQTGTIGMYAFAPEGPYRYVPIIPGFSCPNCQRQYSPSSLSLFNFNSPVGACPDCAGLGLVSEYAADLIIDDEKSINDGAIRPLTMPSLKRRFDNLFQKAATKVHLPLSAPFRALNEHEQAWVLSGQPIPGAPKTSWPGIQSLLNNLANTNFKLGIQSLCARYRRRVLCPTCLGSRLNLNALSWRIGSLPAAMQALGELDRFIPIGLGKEAQEKLPQTPGLCLGEIMQLPVSRLLPFLQTLDSPNLAAPTRTILNECLSRLSYLMDVGLDYLSMDRQSRTLSAGETQRLNLTVALGTRLVDTLFVLDEPSAGLHPRDMQRILSIIERLKKAGNTIIAIEHDPQIITEADRVIDLGPGPGEKGGNICFDGSPKDLRYSGTSTGQYLRHDLCYADKKDSKLSSTIVRPPHLLLEGACARNIRDLRLLLPLEALVCISGVSGSGKSTLVSEILLPALQSILPPGTVTPTEAVGSWTNIDISHPFRHVVYVSQDKLAKNERSTPAKYIHLHTFIKNLYITTLNQQGYSIQKTDFNESGHSRYRCLHCEGTGIETVEMQFLSDLNIPCSFCQGTGMTEEGLALKIQVPGYEDKNLVDILDLTVSEFKNYLYALLLATNKWSPDCGKYFDTLNLLSLFGLDHIHLGQKNSTLSAGELQRLKLANAIGLLNLTPALTSNKKIRTKNLLILDEPTTGLHFSEVSQLIKILKKLVEFGCSVIVIEHNLQVLRVADWIVDLGPESGENGGCIVFQGGPEEIKRTFNSYTAQALRDYEALINYPHKRMPGISNTTPVTPPAAGRSMQSVWREARDSDIGIFGAKEHNLNNVDVVIPKRALTVITGVSGSGKSSLAFNTLFAEGQRRYLSSVSAYARSMVQPPSRPDVQYISGIAPTIAIEQRTSRGGSKSTVGTMTEVLHYLRLLYARLGVQTCPTCSTSHQVPSVETLKTHLLEQFGPRPITIACIAAQASTGTHAELLQSLKEQAPYPWLWIDGCWYATNHIPKLDARKKHTILWPVHAGPISQNVLTKALQAGQGTIAVWDQELTTLIQKKESTFPSSYWTNTDHCLLCHHAFTELEPGHFSFNTAKGWCPTCLGNGRIEVSGIHKLCSTCVGTRLNSISKHVRFGNVTLPELLNLPIDQALTTLQKITLLSRDRLIAHEALNEVITRLKFLSDLGLQYLSLDRSSPTLSGGESQRIHLAAQLSSPLQGICYVLDEPTIGLHPRDNRMLINTLEALRNKGNTVVVVEHDEEMIRRADHIIDVGPGAGQHGGNILCQGDLTTLLNQKDSLTGKFLTSPPPPPLKPLREVNQQTPSIWIKNATHHNLNNLSVRIPAGRLVVLTGVSGSGKSTLGRDVLIEGMQSLLNKHLESSDALNATIQYSENLKLSFAAEVDQSPVGSTSRSCPATYIQIAKPLRDLFASLPQAQIAGLNAEHFSFNRAAGRCPDCDGIGAKRLAMHFLPDAIVPCETCHGMRFSPQVLAIRWHGLSFGDVLNLTAQEALNVFAHVPNIAPALQLMCDVGLDYLRLGQQTNTLSGGESQRIKLVNELAKSRQRNGLHGLYLFDEPSVGLHMADVERLLNTLQKLVSFGHTVVVIEHNLDIMAHADWIIDLGPESGNQGGKIVGEGTPQEIAKLPTATGRELARFYASHGR